MTEPENSRVRASDSDREAVAERLREAQSEGRLSLTEYDERLQHAYAAVTRADLVPLTADLPATTAATSSEVKRRRGLPPEWRSWANVALILITIWGVTSIASGGATFFWPMFPLGIWGAVLLGQTLFGHDHHHRRDHHRKRDEQDDDT